MMGKLIWKGLLLGALVLVMSGCEKREKTEEAVPGPKGMETMTPDSAEGMSESFVFRLTSPAFKDGEPIPRDFTCDGRDVSPALKWENAPKGSAGFALIMEDPDAPSGTFTHWIIVNIPPTASGLDEGIPGSETLDNGAIQGRNSAGKIGYMGPCPPSGTHRYYFKVYALHMMLDVKPGVDRATVESLLQEHSMGKAELMGTYSR